jgi:2-hydroxychromene-2-carboxylate isomerase
MDQKPVVKMYSDFKSPYAFLAFKPGIELARKYNVNIKWRPVPITTEGQRPAQHLLRMEGKIFLYGCTSSRKSAL